MSQIPDGPNPYAANQPPSDTGYPPAAPRGGMPWWGWVLIGVGVFVALPCVTCVGWMAYVGSVGPETSVYAGNQTPSRFVDTMRDVGALEPDEQLQYFYSDALSDIRNGFYFVSDRKVVVYGEEFGSDPLTIVPFDQIADVQLERNTSFFIDSQITLEQVDGTVIWFPVSSEHDRDERFYEAIRRGMEQASSPSQ